MMVMCDDIVIGIIELGGRRLGLSSAPLDMEYGNTRIEESTDIAQKHTT